MAFENNTQEVIDLVPTESGKAVTPELIEEEALQEQTSKTTATPQENKHDSSADESSSDAESLDIPDEDNTEPLLTKMTVTQAQINSVHNWHQRFMNPQFNKDDYDLAKQCLQLKDELSIDEIKEAASVLFALDNANPKQSSKRLGLLKTLVSEKSTHRADLMSNNDFKTFYQQLTSHDFSALNATKNAEEAQHKKLALIKRARTAVQNWYKLLIVTGNDPTFTQQIKQVIEAANAERATPAEKQNRAYLLKAIQLVYEQLKDDKLNAAVQSKMAVLDKELEAHFRYPRKSEHGIMPFFYVLVTLYREDENYRKFENFLNEIIYVLKTTSTAAAAKTKAGVTFSPIGSPTPANDPTPTPTPINTNPTTPNLLTPFQTAFTAATASGTTVSNDDFKAALAIRYKANFRNGNTVIFKPVPETATSRTLKEVQVFARTAAGTQKQVATIKGNYVESGSLPSDATARASRIAYSCEIAKRVIPGVIRINGDATVKLADVITAANHLQRAGRRFTYNPTLIQQLATAENKTVAQINATLPTSPASTNNDSSPSNNSNNPSNHRGNPESQRDRRRNAPNDPSNPGMGGTAAESPSPVASSSTSNDGLGPRSFNSPGQSS